MFQKLMLFFCINGIFNGMKFTILSHFHSVKQGCPKCDSRADSALGLILFGSLHGLDICNL